jgi:hypothetical protein
MLKRKTYVAPLGALIALLALVALAACGAAPGRQPASTTTGGAAQTTYPAPQGGAAQTTYPAPQGGAAPTAYPPPLGGAAEGTATPAPAGTSASAPTRPPMAVTAAPAQGGQGAVTPAAGGLDFGDVPADKGAAAVADLSQRTGLAAGEVTVVSGEAVEWPDGSVGCPKPGMMYPQVITPGYKLVLSAGGQTYNYHASDRGEFFLCENK